MNCSKCNSEIEIKSKFCNNCGTKVEEKSLELMDVIKGCIEVWYILGYIKGSDKIWSDKIEKSITKDGGLLWELHYEVLKRWQKWEKESKKTKNEN